VLVREIKSGDRLPKQQDEVKKNPTQRGRGRCGLYFFLRMVLAINAFTNKQQNEVKKFHAEGQRTLWFIFFLRPLPLCVPILFYSQSLMVSVLLLLNCILFILPALL
jgi:hypothetical protein